MSLLSNERVIIALEPRLLALVRVRGALAPRIVAKQTVRCDPGPGAEPWHGALAALEAIAASLHARESAVRVVLSNHFVRYAIVAADAAASSTEEDMGLARFAFARIHGERAKTWDIRLSAAPGGRDRLACGIDQALIDSIKAYFPRGGKARLVSIQPYLMSAFNRMRRMVPADGAVILVAEHDRLCIASWVDNNWLGVRNIPKAPASIAEHVILLEQERGRLGGESMPHTALVHPPQRLRKARQSSHWSFRPVAPLRLQGFTLAADDAYAMALSAL